MTESTLKSDPHGNQTVLNAGQPLGEAKKLMILVHGRGAGARDIVGLASVLNAPEFAYLAPQAANSTWYPYSFLAEIDDNEPGLSSGLGVLARLLDEAQAAGIAAENVVLGGFSQGACLASEFVARNAQRYGGLLAFSGGLIGPPGTPRDYAGSLAGTPVFLGCSDVDMHIPLERVEETAAVLASMGGAVSKQIYAGMGHTIVQDEIDRARRVLGLPAITPG